MFSPRSASRTQAGLSASPTQLQQAANWLCTPAAQTTLKPGLVEFLKAVRYRWMAASAAALGVAGVVGVATWILTPRSALKYQATALLTLDSKAPVLLSAESYNGNDLASYRRTQIDLLKSRAILVPAVHKP